MIDTHAHLDALEDAPGAIARAHESGVSRIVTVGTVLAADADPRDHAERRHVRVQFTLISEPHRDRLLAFILDALARSRAS